MMRVGQGFDLHRLESGLPFRLGGVDIPWESGPVGHSDGDVVLHSVIDALLGATGKGDIGDWFPPGDPKTQNIDSVVLLNTVWASLRQEHWHVQNLDITVLLEAPKLKPYKMPIRECLAQLLGLSIDQVSLKAKTMEGLGDIGQGNAVAAMATVLISQPTRG